VERNPQWRAFREELNASGTVKDLNSLLIMPIQRIPRYLLLLNVPHASYFLTPNVKPLLTQS
jgi:hypothetical protein